MNKIRSYFNKERSVFNAIQKLPFDSYTTLVFNDGGVNAGTLFDIDTLKQIVKPENNQFWVNNSDNSDVPPDYYSDEFNLMMDMMRVSEYEWILDDGKILNPLTTNETSHLFHQIQRLENGEDIDMDAISIVDLSRNDNWRSVDHSYSQWLDAFARVVMRHNEKIGLYRQNHPGYNTIFCIYDDSRDYIERRESIDGQSIDINHIWWLDESFISVLKNINCEYVFWFTPHKAGKIKGLLISIRDLKKEYYNPIRYSSDKMVSVQPG